MQMTWRFSFQKSYNLVTNKPNFSYITFLKKFYFFEIGSESNFLSRVGSGQSHHRSTIQLASQAVVVCDCPRVPTLYSFVCESVSL